MTDTSTDVTPKPGSDDAIGKGCTCPVLDNAHGRGYMGQPEIFVYTVGCPVHCPPPAREVLQEHSHD